MSRRPRPPESSPGIAPLGRHPFSKKGLEPKIHHDDHGPDASVPAKGTKRAIPSEHWEMQYNSQQPMDRPEAKFDPICARDRPKMYNKINETDH